MPRKLEYKWHHMAKVTIPPGGQFPVDMLRYDSCFPVRTVDALNLVERAEEEREVYVARASESKKEPGWTVGRWRSFLVQIEPVDSLPPGH